MKNRYLYNVKNILRELWRDFKNSPHYYPSQSSCCGFEPTYDEFPLQLNPIRVNNTDKQHIQKFKK